MFYLFCLHYKCYLQYLDALLQGLLEEKSRQSQVLRRKFAVSKILEQS